jgi:hypothetical protein
MVAHLWANKAQDEARSQRGNFYFTGDTIYSYGSHFPVARHVENRRGESAVLITTRDYSVTTAGHKSAVAGAARHLTVFHVQHPRNEGPAARRADFEEYRQRQRDLMASYAKARGRKPRIFQSVAELIEEANNFAKFFGLRSRLKMPADEADMTDECAKIDAANKRRTAREAREREKAIAAADAERQRKRDEWLAGTGNYYPGGWGESVRLRVVGDKLETSGGAEVELSEALRVLAILRKLRDKGYKRNGGTIAVGPFELDSMDLDGTITVGCHTIEWAEVERIAAIANAPIHGVPIVSE